MAAGKYGRDSRCKQCVKEYKRQQYADKTSRRYQYYIEHREKVKERSAQWRTDNPNYYHQYYVEHHDKFREYAKQRRPTHQEEVKKYRQEYRATHQEKVKKYARKHYIANREKIAERNRQYRINHPEKMAVYNERRRARNAKAEGSFTAEEWQELCEKYSNKCLCCGRDDIPLTVDHVIPISKGGSNNIENCQCLCKPCNSKKHTKTIDYRPDSIKQTPEEKDKD